jgi:hypothetical protein
VQQQGEWASQKGPPVFLSVALGALRINRLVHSRLVLQRPGVHAHNYGGRSAWISENGDLDLRNAIL